MEQIADAHLPILAALRRRDPELAGKEMRHHIEYFGALAVGPPSDIAETAAQRGVE
jgi:DNA-binding GntR family transcriptional regulator